MSKALMATPRVKWIQRIALAMLVVAGAINYVVRATLAVANPLIRQDLGLSELSEANVLVIVNKIGDMLTATATGRRDVPVLQHARRQHRGSAGRVPQIQRDHETRAAHRHVRKAAEARAQLLQEPSAQLGRARWQLLTRDHV